MSGRPLIDDTLLLLKTSGFVCYNPTLWSNIRKTLILTLTFVNYIDVIAWTIINRNEPDVLEGFTIVVAFTQIFLKMSMTALQGESILKTVSKMEEFWPIDKYGPQQEKLIKKIFNAIKLSIRTFLGFVCLTVLSFSVKPFLTEEVGHIYQVFSCFVSVPASLGFEFMYISLITNIICELRMLKVGFSEIPISSNSASDKRTMSALKELIDHHNVVLECSKYLRDIVYIPFLCIFLTCMVAIGFCLLCIISSGNATETISFGGSALYYVIVLFMYCYPGTILISESTEISNTVYETDWWIKTQPELRRAYVMIIQRANRPVMLSAGGMMNVTLESFTAIMKNALSFFTFVQAMYTDD